MAKKSTWIKQSDDSYVQFEPNLYSNKKNLRVFVRRRGYRHVKGMDDWNVWTEDLNTGREQLIGGGTKAQAIRMLRGYMLSNPITEKDRRLRYGSYSETMRPHGYDMLM